MDDALALIQKAVADALQTYNLVIVNAGSSAAAKIIRPRSFERSAKSSCMALLSVLVTQRFWRMPTSKCKGEVHVNRSAKRWLACRVTPVSAAITFDLLIKPLLACWQGQATPEAPQIEAVLTQAVTSAPDQDEFLRVSLAEVGKRIVAMPLTRSAGMIMSMVRADGLLHLPRGHTGYGMGDTVAVAMQTSLQQIRNTVIIAGVIAGPPDRLWNFWPMN